MPNRILREGILTSERVAKLAWAEEVFYRRLMSVVDDYGRFHATPMLIRAACFPLKLDQVTDPEIEKWLVSAQSAKLVVVYTAGGKRCLQLLDFRQQVRAKDSKFPAPDEQTLSACVADAAQMQANAHLDVFGDGGGGGGGGEMTDPDGSVVASRPATPTCPHSEIVNLYHEQLPSLTQVREWTSARQTLLRKRWSEDPERQKLDWWRSFFDFVGKSDFLMGRSSSRNGAPFECDLEWLIRPTNFVKVLEGKYENRGAAA
jgi:hypothetical protein